MLPRSLCLFALVFASFSLSAEIELGEDGRPKIDMLAHFKPYTGRLVGKVRSKPTALIPEPFEIAGEQEGRYVLGNTTFQFRTVGEMDGQKGESLYLYAYDRTEKAYCCWQYNDVGGVIKYKVEWAEDGKSFKQVSLNDEEIGASITTHVVLDDGKTIRWTSKIVTKDGQLAADQTGELTVEPGAVAFVKPVVDQDSELAIYKPYTGSWRTTIKGKETDVFEEPYELSSDWNGRYVLGGKVFEFSGKASTVFGEDYEYLWYTFYDEREERYVPMYHDSLGNHARHDADWDEERRAMRMVPDNTQELGFKPVFTVYFVDDKTMRTTLRLTTNDGRLISDESGVSNPVQEPGQH
jgi:hypothetical protein